jgi:hypothetical protein
MIAARNISSSPLQGKVIPLADEISKHRPASSWSDLTDQIAELMLREQLALDRTYVLA